MVRKGGNRPAARPQYIDLAARPERFRGFRGGFPQSTRRGGIAGRRRLLRRRPPENYLRPCRNRNGAAWLRLRRAPLQWVTSHENRTHPLVWHRPDGGGGDL